MSWAERQEYRNGGAAKLPAGPWTEEPDKVQWLDPATGLDCLIVRGGLGALCGYVGVQPGHPWHRIDYSGCTEPAQHADKNDTSYCAHAPESRIEVHGGLTYSALCDGDDQDVSRHICHVPLPGRPHDVWWFGFDCSHSGDFVPSYGRALGMPMPFDLYSRPAEYRDVAYVRGEVERLAAQLAVVSA